MNKAIEYLRSIEGKVIRPGIECNSMVANLLTILHPQIKSDLKQVITKLKNCSSLVGIRKIIREDKRTSRKYLEMYGYNPIVSNQIKQGDFLIKPRKFFDDCIFVVDCNTYAGIAPIKINNHNSAEVVLNKKIHISINHIIYRR